jgi:hypothetical protein
MANLCLPTDDAGRKRIVGETKMRQNQFPAGWNEERVRRVLIHYEEQSEQEAIAEDEAAFQDQVQAVSIQELSTMWAVVREGKIELVEKMNLPEGTRVLVTLLPEVLPNI